MAIVGGAVDHTGPGATRLLRLRPLVRGTECVELLAHEERQPLDLRRPREVARHTAKGRDRFGAHEKIDSGVVTPADRAFHGDANRRLARRGCSNEHSLMSLTFCLGWA